MLRSTGTCLLLILAVLAAASSCRTTHTYGGEKLDREDIAVLKVPYYAKGLFITVESIDGEIVNGEAYAKLGVLPGHHVIEGRARGFGQSRDGFPYTLDFMAETGATYSLDLNQPRFSDKLIISVVDTNTRAKLTQIEIWP